MNMDFDKGFSNTGMYNKGSHNSGIGNNGWWNSGNHNNGWKNSGDHNIGECNTGNHNWGSWNSGQGNFGCNNTGLDNSGHWNCGNSNSGCGNTGNHNSGDNNSGDWNLSSHNNGCFMTEEPFIMMFNKPTEWTFDDWLHSDARFLLGEISDISPVFFVDSWHMTAEEKEEHPEYKLNGGYLMINDKAASIAQENWDELDDQDKLKIFSLPNFDPEIFMECTGLDISESYKKLVEDRMDLFTRIFIRWSRRLGKRFGKAVNQIVLGK